MADEAFLTEPIPLRPSVTRNAVRPYLIVLRGGARGLAIPVSHGLRLGRDPTVEVRLPDHGISRFHTELRETPQGWQIVDLDSRNGLWVAGRRVSDAVLAEGDLVELGQSTTLRFTHRDEMEQRLAEAQRLESLGRLAGGITHDFNNLLAVIATAAEFLKSSKTGDEAEDLEAVQDILDASTRARELTTQLLDFSRGGDSVRRRTSLKSLVADVEALGRRTFQPYHHVSIEMDQDVFLDCDRGRMEQVLLNLMLNARDAMPDGGPIRLISRYSLTGPGRRDDGGLQPPDSGWVLLRVIDEGCGMGPLELSKAFEPFFTTKPQGKGTGLGLAMVYGIIQRHGGKITLDSARGRGTTVSIWLPATAAAPQPVKETVAPPQRRVGPKKSVGGAVLVVDDDSRVRRSTARLIRSKGDEVVSVDGGLAALEFLTARRAEVALVLLDLVMPGMSGKETLEHIRARWPDLPVHICSGYEISDVSELIQSGAKGFLRKPFTSNELFTALYSTQGR